jgi:RND family efflux transporter MFP subunit
MRIIAKFLFILLISAAACTESGTQPQPRPIAENVVTVRTGKLAPQADVERLRWTAVTAPRAEVSLTFKGSGRIKTLHFEEGAVVKQGDLLGTLVEEDYWSYRKLAQIQVRTLEPDARRMQNLAVQDALPQAEADRMQGKVNVAKAQLRQADAALSGVFLRAPVAGVIEKKSVAEGDLVSPAREVGKLLDLSQVRVVISASERELVHLAPGATVNLEFSDPAMKTTGKIDRISPLADFRTRTFPVTILIDNEFAGDKPVLRGGMKVVVSLELPGAPALRVPFSAVLRAEDRRTYVYLVRAGRAVMTYVRTGRLFQGRLEILEGLAAGDEVVLSGQQFLREGTEVTIRADAPLNSQNN